ncbi:MAG: oligosaccharide flippase family protein [Bacteroidetes bacterium]|nr:oligosaccharide flippase family protein [Bacteroidota bacterium]
MKRPVRNVLSYVIGDAGSRMLGFLVAIYLARILAPEGFGLISIGLAVLGHLMLLASPGIQMLETRNVAAATGISRERAAGVLTLRVGLAVTLVVATVAVAGVWLDATPIRDIVVLYVVCLLPMSFFLDWFFQGKEEFHVVAIARVAQFLVYAAVAVILIRDNDDVLFAPIAFFAGAAAGSLILLIAYWRQHGRLRFAWNPQLWWSILRGNAPVGGVVFIAQMVTNLPPIVIALILTTTDVGVYSGAMRLAFVVLFVDRLVNALFLPLVTRYLSTRGEEASYVATIVMKVLVILFLPVAACGIIISPEVITLVYGPGFEGGAPVLQVLLSYVALTIINTIFVCTLIGAGREKQYSRVMLFGSLILVLLMVVFTMLFGIIGTAAGIAVGEGLIAAMMALETAKVAGFSSFRRVTATICAVLGIGLAGPLFGEGQVGILALTLLIAYAVALMGVGGLSRAEVRFLRERII